jgi:aminopeptidase
MKIDRKSLEIWAGHLVNHSIGGVDKNDVVMIKGERIAWPLISICQDMVFSAGGTADVNLVAPDNDRGKVWGASITRHGTVEQINRIPDWQRQRYEGMNKYIEVMGAESPSLFTNLPEETNLALVRADEPYKNIRLLKNWVITLFPTQGFADLEEMSLDEYADVVVSASTFNPRLLEEIEEPVRKLMDESRDVRIVTDCPDKGRRLELRMNIESRNIRKCTGQHNLPDGEVFTSPDARSVEGEVFVDLPVFYEGVTVQGIYLKFEGGVIKEYSALQGMSSLEKIIETDEGSMRLGEVAFGTNAGISRVLKHPLFVEKVGGTMHIAIGQSYPECYVDNPSSEEGRAECDSLFRQGIINRSARHVDIVIDFRPGGAGREVFLDDKQLVVKGGNWSPAD